MPHGESESTQRRRPSFPQPKGAVVFRKVKSSLKTNTYQRCKKAAGGDGHERITQDGSQRTGHHRLRRTLRSSRDTQRVPVGTRAGGHGAAADRQPLRSRKAIATGRSAGSTPARHAA